MKELPPYKLSELVTGNWNLLKNVLSDHQTVFVYDNDGIISDTSEIVYRRFNEKYGTKIKTCDIRSWHHLTDYARTHGFSENDIMHAEDDFYQPDVFEKAYGLLYIKPVIQKTISYYGAQNNYILTSRNSEFKDVTVSWFERKFPEILSKNILIRDENKVSGEDFKIENLKRLASNAPWIVFVDDALKFVKPVLKAGIGNCLVINIPQGKTAPDFTHDHLVVIKRFPDEIQAMYPLMDVLDRVHAGRSL